MTIYVDTLIFTNIIIDYILLDLTSRILKINYKLYRIVLASLVGGMSSLTILLPEQNFVFNIIIRVCFTIILTLTAFGFGSKIIFLKRNFILFLITSCFSGLIIFMLSIIKSDFIAINNNVVYLNISPIMLIILTTISYIILKFIDKIRIDKGNLIHKISFEYAGKSYNFLSRYDTCCHIKEPFSGSEVILAEKSLMKNIIIPNDKYRVIPFNSLGGEGMIKGFLPEGLYIDNEKINRKVYIGITENILKGEINSIFNYKNICE